MNPHIIVNFTMFTLEQDVYVYIDGACIAQTKALMKDIPNIVNGYRNQYHINQIDLYGDDTYLTKTKSALLNTFSNAEECKINIIKK